MNEDDELSFEAKLFNNGILLYDNLPPEIALNTLMRSFCYILVTNFKDDEVTLFSVLKLFSERMPGLVKIILKNIKARE